MKICVSGWYFHPPFLQAIATDVYEALIVGHRDCESFGIPVVLTPNGAGLDFGCYQQYLMEHWDGESDVLFIQDDGEIHGTALTDIAALADKADIDHAYIFRDEYDEYANAGKSSRAMWCRRRFLSKVRRVGGFPVDWTNIGDTKGKQANNALEAFHQWIKGKPRLGWAAIVPGLHMARRGWLSNHCYQYKRASDGIVTPQGLTVSV